MLHLGEAIQFHQLSLRDIFIDGVTSWLGLLAIYYSVLDAVIIFPCYNLKVETWIDYHLSYNYNMDNVLVSLIASLSTVKTSNLKENKNLSPKKKRTRTLL